MTDVLNNEDIAKKLTLRANALSEFGRHEQAITLYLRAIAETPDHALLHLRVAEGYLKLNKCDNAEKHAKAAILINPEIHISHCQLAWVYSMRGSNTLAMHHAKTAISIAPEGGYAVWTLAKIELRAEDYEKSLITAKLLIKLEPNDAYSHDLLADIYSEMNNFKTAELYYRKALRINPIGTNTHIGLGKCLAARNKPKEAAEHMLIVTKSLVNSEFHRLNFYRHVLGIIMKHPEHPQSEILAGFSPEVQKHYIKHINSYKRLILHDEIKDVAEVMDIYRKSKAAHLSISTRFFNSILGLIKKLAKHIFIIIISIFPIITIINYFFY